MLYPAALFGKYVAIRFVTTGEKGPVRIVAAQMCYVGCNVVFLRRYAAHEGVDVPPAASLFEVTKLLLAKVLKLKENEMFPILKVGLDALSKQVIGVHSPLLECDEATLYANKDDKDAIVKEKEKQEGSDCRRKTFAGEYSHFVAKSKDALRLDGKLKVAEKIKMIKALGEGKPKVVPEGELSEDVARTLAPNGAMLCVEARDQCWRGSYGEHARTSRAMALYGGNRCALLSLLAALWGLALAEKGLAEADCPVKGIFDRPEDGAAK